MHVETLETRLVLSGTDFRTPLPGEGLLHFVSGATAGNERTGWIDTRHPVTGNFDLNALPADGINHGSLQDTDLGYDRSDFFVNVDNKVVKSVRKNGNVVTASPDIPSDFNYANQAWAQAGLSVLSTGVSEVNFIGGSDPILPYTVLAGATDQATIQSSNRHPDWTVVNNWYATVGSHSSGILRGAAITPGLSVYSTPSNLGSHGTMVFDSAHTNTANSDLPDGGKTTFAHELGHFLLNRWFFQNQSFVHSTPESDLLHDGGSKPAAKSLKQVAQSTAFLNAPVEWNTMWPTSQAVAVHNAYVRVMEVSGIDNKYVVQREDTNNVSYGDRVDFHWVEDNSRLSRARVDDQPPTGLADRIPDIVRGTEPLQWTIQSISSPPSTTGHNTSDWMTGTQASSISALGGYGDAPINGTSFNVIDVFSQVARYSDNDQYHKTVTSDEFRRDAALDYKITVSADGINWVAPRLVEVFDDGWTDKSQADDFIARWWTDLSAKFVRIEAKGGRGTDGNTQIDAIVVANSSNAVTGFAFQDRRGPGESSGVEPNASFDDGDELQPGIEVELVDSGGTTIRTTTTDENGQYTFINIPTGQYRVRFAKPKGQDFSVHGSPGANESHVNSIGETDLFTVGSIGTTIRNAGTNNTTVLERLHDLFSRLGLAGNRLTEDGVAGSSGSGSASLVGGGSEIVSIDSFFSVPSLPELPFLEAPLEAIADLDTIFQEIVDGLIEPVELAAVSAPGSHVLTNDAVLMVSVDGVSFTPLVISATDTASNTSVADLVSDIDLALFSAGLGTSLFADIGDSGEIVIASQPEAIVPSLIVTTVGFVSTGGGADSDIAQYGQLDATSGVLSGLTIDVERTNLDASGTPQAPRLMETYVIGDIGITPPASPTEPLVYTQDNTSLHDLAADLQTAFVAAGLLDVRPIAVPGADGIEGTSDDRLMLIATAEGVERIEVTGSSGSRLGFATGEFADITSIASIDNAGYNSLNFLGDREVAELSYFSIDTFVTAIAERMAEISDLPLPSGFDIDATYDEINETLEFNVAIGVTFADVVELDLFTGIDLGALLGTLEVAALAEANVELDAQLDLRLGIYLGELGSGYTISGSTPLASLNDGDGVNLLVGIEGDQAIATNGQVGNDATFSLTFTRDGGDVENVMLNLPEHPLPSQAALPIEQRTPNTDDNSSAEMLVADLNRLLEQTVDSASRDLSDVVRARLFESTDISSSVSHRIVFEVIDPDVRKLTISGGDLIGFSGTVDSHFDDLWFQLRSGHQFGVNLDGAETIGDVISSIESASEIASLPQVSVGLNVGGNGLQIADLSVGTNRLMILPGLAAFSEVETAPGLFEPVETISSTAGLSLSILGNEEDVDINNDGVLDASDADGIVEGAPLHGLGLDDRVYIVEQATGQAADHKHLQLDARIEAEVDATAALGEIALDMSSRDVDPLTFAIGIDMNLTDPDSNNRIYLSEITLANLSTIIGTPMLNVEGSGTIDVGVNVLEAIDVIDLDELLGEVEPAVSLSFSFDSGSGEFLFTPDTNFTTIIENFKDLGVEDFIGLLERLVTQLRNDPDLDFLNQEVPLLDLSLNDVLAFADGILEGANDLISGVGLDDLVDIEAARIALETAVNNLSLTLDERAALFNQLAMLRRVASVPDADQLLDEFGSPTDWMDRLPARLLSATAQLGKIIHRDVATTTVGYADVIGAYVGLLKHVPALNSLEDRLADALEDAINDALAPPSGSPLTVDVHIGFADFDGITTTALDREDRMVVLGVELSAPKILEKTFAPAVPPTAALGPVNFEFDAEATVVAGGSLAIGLAIDPRLTVDDDRFFLVVNPPDDATDDLVQTRFDVGVGLDSSASGDVGFGSLGLISADVEFTMLSSAREVISDPPTAFTSGEILLSDTPSYFKDGSTFDDDGRMMIVVVKDENLGQTDVLTFEDGEYKLLPQGSGPPKLQIVYSDIDLADATEVTIEYPIATNPGPQNPMRAMNFPATFAVDLLPTQASLTQKFSLASSGAIESALDAGTVPAGVVSGFLAGGGITLAGSATVKVQEAGSRWLLTSSGVGFTLIKNGAVIDVYDLPNALGAVAFGDLGSDTDFNIDLQGMLHGAIDGELLGNDVDNILTLAASLNHLGQPRLTFDPNALSDLFKLDFDLKTIVAGIDKFLAELEEGVMEEVVSSLPLAGDGMDPEQTFIGKLRSKVTQPLLDLLCNTGGTLDEVEQAVEQFLFNELGPAGLNILGDVDGGGIATIGDSSENDTLDTTTTDIDVELTTDKFEIHFQLAGRDEFLLDFNFGEGIALAGEGGLEFGWDFSLDFGVGVSRTDGFYLIDAADAELELMIGAGLAVDDSDPSNPIPTSLAVNLFGLELSATDILTPTGETGTGVSGLLSIDLLDPNNDGQILLAELTSQPFGDSIVASMSADVDVNLNLAAGINNNLPSIETDLFVDWMANLSYAGGNFSFDQTGLTVKFLDLGINLGDFLSEQMGSVVRTVDRYLEPIKPVVDLLTTRVPGVSELSEAAGRGPVDFLDLAFIRNPGPAEDARKFVDTVATIIDVVDSLAGIDPSDNLFVVLSEEEVVLGGGPGTGSGVAYAGGGLDASGESAIGSNVTASGSGGIVAGLQNVQGKLAGLFDRLHEIGVVIHFVEDPSNIVSMLMGQPFDVVSWDIPRFELPFTFEAEFPVIPVPKIDVRVGLDAEIFADLSVGYDSHGLETGNFFHGFYFGDREDVFAGADIDEFGLGLGVRLAALLDLLIVQAGVEGEIRADILANWRDSDDDGKLHADEIARIVRNDGIECLFELHGQVRAIVRAVWEFTLTGSTGSKDFIDEILFSFDDLIECPKYELGHVSAGETLPGVTSDMIALDGTFADFNSPGTLVLHAGPFASLRGPGATSDVAEVFEVEEVAPGVFKVKGMGLESQYHGVERIYFSGGNANDALTLIDVTVPVAAFGGAGNDLLHGTRNRDLLNGGSGDDEIFGRGESDVIFGGSGSDLIHADLEPGNTDVVTWGTGAADRIEAGSGNDEVFGQEGDDEIYGDAGDDRLFGAAGADTIHAGAGLDIVYGGDGSDTIFGDAGNDQLFGESNNDVIDGGTGADLVMGHRGDDDLIGGSGLDVIIGGLGIDLLKGGRGNDILAGGLGTENMFLRDVIDSVLPTTTSITTIDAQEAIDYGMPDDDDQLWGGLDNDFLIGDAGADQLFGGWGDDLILTHVIGDTSATSNEYVEGGPGDDFICASAGADEVYGGTADAGLADILAIAGGAVYGGYSVESCESTDVVVQLPPTTSELSGIKFNDLNGDGVRDPGEMGLSGWTILLIDADGDVIDSTVTDADGAFVFDQLEPGDYQLAEEQQTDWTQITSDHQLSLLPDETIADLDFGNQFNGGTIVGQKWHDLNGNGLRESGEQGLNGWQIELLDADGAVIASTLTADIDLDNNGSIDFVTERGIYQFDDLPSGDYAVREVPQSGWVQSAPDLAATDTYLTIPDDGFSSLRSQALATGVASSVLDVKITLDIDHTYRGDLHVELESPSGTRVTLFSGVGENLDNFESITLSDAAVDEIGDISAVQAAAPTITTFQPAEELSTFAGEEANGQWTLIVRDDFEGESGGLRGWSVAITDGSGVTSFAGGAPDLFDFGRTVVREVSLATGATENIDFGNFRVGFATGVKFVDRDGDGARNAVIEPGLAGVTIYADLNNNGALDLGEPQTLTQPDDLSTTAEETGSFILTPLPPGDYVIREVADDGLTQTSPAAGGGILISVGSGAVVDELEFGNVPPVTVHGEKWLDVNGDGKRDPDEPGLNGIVIYADLNNNGMRDAEEPASVTMDVSTGFVLPGDFNEDGRVDGSDYTVWRDAVNDPAATAGDANGDGTVDDLDYAIWKENFGRIATQEQLFRAGQYWLTDVPIGVVTIREELPADMVMTFPTLGFHRLQIIAGEPVVGVNFGNRPGDQAPGSIRGVKVFDENGNDIPDQEDIPQPGVVIYVDLNSNGQFEPALGEPSDVTATDGSYHIMGVPAGTWQVREVVPPGYTQVFPAAPGYHLVTVLAGQTAPGVRFANQFGEQASGSSTLTSNLAPNGLVAFWDFENNFADTAGMFVENVGSVADDLLSNQSPPGVTFGPGVSGDSVFVTPTEVLRTTMPGDLVLTSAFTVEGFVRPEARGTILESFDATTHFRVQWDQMDVRLEWLVGGAPVASTAPLPMPGGVWTHLAVVGIGSDLQFWVGGQFAGSISTPTVVAMGLGQGDEIRLGGQRYAGDFDKVALWDVALTDVEIPSHAQNPQECYELTPIEPGENGSIHGQKFLDANANGKRDEGEVGLDGWEIELYDTAGNVIAIAVTMSMDTNQDGEIDPITEQGLFWFEDVPEGGYTIGERLQDGWRQTVPGTESIREPGDANEDGVFDQLDLAQLREWDRLGADLISDWFQGDFNGDLRVNAEDILLAEATGNFGRDPYFSDADRRLSVDIGPGVTLEGILFGNFEPIPLPDGDDIIFAGQDDDLIRGDNLVSDPLVFSVGTRRDTIYGQSGNDRLFGQEEDDVLWGADDMVGLVTAGTDTDLVDGGLGFDEVVQIVDADQLLTNSLLTGQGPDSLVSIERATLIGGGSANVLDATAFSGNVSLFGLAGDDTLRGGTNDDLLDGGTGNDALLGGTGDDQYQFSPIPNGSPFETDTVSELPAEGTDRLDFSPLDMAITVDLLSTTIAQQPGTSNVRQVIAGGAGQQANLEDIVGTQFDDTLRGNAANNLILGLAGSDSVQGEAGNDTIDLGGGAADSADGGAGDDLYRFDAGWGTATLTDLSGIDQVNMSAITVPLTWTIGSLNVSDGTNQLIHVGSDLEVLVGGQASDVFEFANGATLPFAGSIDGQGDIDTLDYSAYMTMVAVDLSGSTATGVPGGVTNLENVTGGHSGDLLTGDGGVNLLLGNGGADTLSGLGADDELRGGTGGDTLLGGAGDDLLIGGLGGDLLDGGEHSDYYFVESGDGSDVLDDTGISGTDTLDLSTLTSDLDWTVGGGAAPAHTVIEFNGVGGELIRFTGSVESIDAGSGDDHVELHNLVLLQNAVIRADEGADTIDYSPLVTPVIVNLSLDPFQDPELVLPPTHPANTATGTGGVFDFEHVVGSATNDILIGSVADNILTGGGGNDDLFGLRGDDRLIDGGGTDRAFGGAGDDWYLVHPFSLVTVGEDGGTVVAGQAIAGGVDTLDFSLFATPVTVSLVGSEFENVIGSPTAANNITGNDRANQLVGGSANDTLIGGDGDDFLVGLAGIDNLDGGSDNDILIGGAGGDTITGGLGRDLLVGGTGIDIIDANDDEEDLVVPDSTSYEMPDTDPSHVAAWNEFRATWSDPGKSRALRETLVASGVGTGPFQLVVGLTLFDDGQTDSVTVDTTGTGSPIDDWLLEPTGESITSLLVEGALASIDEELGETWSRRSEQAVRDLAFSVDEELRIEIVSDDLALLLGRQVNRRAGAR